MGIRLIRILELEFRLSRFRVFDDWHLAEWQENETENLVICINTQSMKQSIKNKQGKNNVSPLDCSLQIVFFKHRFGDFMVMGFNSCKRFIILWNVCGTFPAFGLQDSEMVDVERPCIEARHFAGFPINTRSRFLEACLALTTGSEVTYTFLW